MTQYSLDPAFVQINYTSIYSPHKMILPTRAWDADLGTNGRGGYIAWDDEVVDAYTMITSFVDDLAALHPSTTTFEDAIIYTKASPTAENHPQIAITLAVAGAGVTAAVPAAMQTWSFRSTGFNLFKLVQLDLVVAINFLPTTPADLSAEQLVVVGDLSDTGLAWAARDNTRIGSIIRITAKLSDVLRKAYRLT